jgi:hypothetical protein
VLDHQNLLVLQPQFTNTPFSAIIGAAHGAEEDHGAGRPERME